MTDIITSIRESLTGHYPPEEIKSLTRLILEKVFGIPAYKLLFPNSKDIHFSDKELQLAGQIVQRLLRHEPIQYIIGTKDFYGMEFKVSPAVLIPRPETEELVDRIIRENRHRTGLRILDIGTGSGIIPITLSKNLLEAAVYACDISPEALAIARENAQTLEADVTFFQLDILDDQAVAVQLQQPFDLIVSNPPYVLDSEKAAMEQNVLDYEPEVALFVPDADPLLFYRQIARIGLKWLNRPGKLYFEINPQCSQAICDLLQADEYEDIHPDRDLEQRDRFVTATLTQ